jgi:hypothetical protein
MNGPDLDTLPVAVEIIEKSGEEEKVTFWSANTKEGIVSKKAKKNIFKTRLFDCGLLFITVYLSFIQD